MYCTRQAVVASSLHVERAQVQSHVHHELEEPLPQGVHHHVVLGVQLGWTSDQTPQQGVDASCRRQILKTTNAFSLRWGERCSTTTLKATQLTLEDDPPGGEEGLEQRDAGELTVLPVVGVQAGQRGLDGQVGEAVSRRRKHVGDAGVHVGVVARVAAELPAHGVRADDVRQIVPEHKHLRRRTEEG